MLTQHIILEIIATIMEKLNLKQDDIKRSEFNSQIIYQKFTNSDIIIIVFIQNYLYEISGYNSIEIEIMIGSTTVFSNHINIYKENTMQDVVEKFMGELSNCIDLNLI